MASWTCGVCQRINPSGSVRCIGCGALQSPAGPAGGPPAMLGGLATSAPSRLATGPTLPVPPTPADRGKVPPVAVLVAAAVVVALLAAGVGIAIARAGDEPSGVETGSGQGSTTTAPTSTTTSSTSTTTTAPSPTTAAPTTAAPPPPTAPPTTLPPKVGQGCPGDVAEQNGTVFFFDGGDQVLNIRERPEPGARSLWTVGNTERVFVYAGAANTRFYEGPSYQTWVTVRKDGQSTCGWTLANNLQLNADALGTFTPDPSCSVVRKASTVVFTVCGDPEAPQASLHFLGGGAPTLGFTSPVKQGDTWVAYRGDDWVRVDNVTIVIFRGDGDEVLLRDLVNG